MAVPELFTCERSQLSAKKIKMLKAAYQNGRNPLQRGVGLQDPRVVSAANKCARLPSDSVSNLCALAAKMYSV